MVIKNIKESSTHIGLLRNFEEAKQSFGFSVAFYISNYGFGHASRNIPIIRYILEANKNIKVIIKTGKAQGSFIRDVIGEFEDRVIYFFEAMDVGLVLKENSLDIDKEKLTEKVLEYLNSFEERIAKEIEFLHYYNINLIISDIVPWIFKCSKKLNISSILISNFTWVEIYKEHLSEEIVKQYMECYKLADKVLFYELYMDEMKEYIDNYKEVSFCSREFDLVKADKIKSSFKRPIVYLSVGRSVNLKDELDVSSLPYDFIVTDGIRVKGKNVYYLDKETPNTQDYLLASDFVITKAGWGTVSEALLGRKKIALLSRDNVAEDRNTIKKLKDMGLAIEVNFNLEDILKDLEQFNPNFSKYNFKNSYKEIVDKIIYFIKMNNSNDLKIRRTKSEI